MKITDNNQIVACLSTLCIYDFIRENEDPQIELQKAIDNKKQSIETWLNHAKNYPSGAEQYLAYAEKDKKVNYQIMTYGEYVKAEKEHYLNLPLTEITEDRWDEMLCVLPPMSWQTINGCNEFLMSEFLTGVYTSQYARKNGKFYHKTVDAYDKTTWIHNFV